MLTQYLGYQMTNDEYKVMGLSSYGTPRYLEQFARSFVRPASAMSSTEALDKREADAEISPANFRRGRSGYSRRSSRICWAPPGARPAAGSAVHGHRGKRPEAARDSSPPTSSRTAIEATGCSGRLPCRRRRAELQDEHGDRAGASGRETLRPPVPHDAGVALGAAMLKCAEAGPHHRAAHPCLLGAGIFERRNQGHAREGRGALRGARRSHHPLRGGPDRAKDRRLVSGTHGVWSAGAGKPVDHRGPAFGGHEGPDQRQHQIPRGIPAILPLGTVRPPDASISTILSSAVHGRDIAGQGSRQSTSIPAVVHVDGTSRIQSVQPETNPLYSRLIEEFAKATLDADADQHQPQHQRAADGELAAGSPAHLFLLRSRRALSGSVPAGKAKIVARAGSGGGHLVGVFAARSG